MKESITIKAENKNGNRESNIQKRNFCPKSKILNFLLRQEKRRILQRFINEKTFPTCFEISYHLELNQRQVNFRARKEKKISFLLKFF